MFLLFISTLTFSANFYLCCSVFTAKFIYVCCLVKAQGFHPGGIHSHFPPHILYSFLCTMWGPRGGECPWAIIKQHKTSLSEFHPTFYTLTLYPPTPLYLSWIKNPSTSQLKCHRTVLLGSKQWPKGLPGRRRLHQQISTMCATLYVFAYVTLIKSTHSLTGDKMKEFQSIGTLMTK